MQYIVSTMLIGYNTLMLLVCCQCAYDVIIAHHGAAESSTVDAQRKGIARA